MSRDGRDDRRLWWVLISLIALAGLLLRVAASRGGLWSDEAWSMVYAEQAGDPIGVFLRINHDNNHHLITLWLQLVGMRASPWLVRLPAVLAGAASILVAALLLEKRSSLAGIIVAVLFAVSPIMLTYGSQARGYAPMILATLTLLLLVTRALERKAPANSRWWLALVTLFGMLSHMTMAAPVAFTTLWVYLEFRSTEGPAAALWTTGRLMAPALTVAVVVPMLVMVAAAMSPTGMRLGGYAPFTWNDLQSALGDLSAWTFGVTMVPHLALAAAAVIGAIVALRPPRWLGSRSRLYAILILGTPLAAAIVHPPNTAFARYFLCSALGMLLLAAECIARAVHGRPKLQAGAAIALACVITASLWEDSLLISSARGHPDEIVSLMRARAPNGARVELETARLAAVADVTAARTGYHLRFVQGCSPVDFIISSEPKRLASARAFDHCGVTMRPIGSGQRTRLTGDSWVLYRSDSSARMQVGGRSSSASAVAHHSSPPLTASASKMLLGPDGRQSAYLE